MTAVIQRAASASVRADGRLCGRCGHGLFILLGVRAGDTGADAALLAKKIAALRIFPDEGGKMNRAVSDTGGEILVVPNFTLAADVSRGTRPSFSQAAAPDEAEALFVRFCALLREAGLHVETGAFGAHMRVSLEADGPVTILMDSRIWKKHDSEN